MQDPYRQPPFRSTRPRGRQSSGGSKIFWSIVASVLLSGIVMFLSGNLPGVTDTVGGVIDDVQQGITGEPGECNLDAALRYLTSMETPEKEREVAKAIIENDQPYLERMNQKTVEALDCTAYHARKNASQ